MTFFALLLYEYRYGFAEDVLNTLGPVAETESI